jgi:MraZ protein
MFIGEYLHGLDDKNRLAVPARFRAELKNGAVLTRGLDSCLFLLTKKDWEELAKKMAGSPLGKADARGFSRFMLAGAMEVKLDGLGRILLPDYLKKYAALSKKAAIIGVNNRLEIWDESRWIHYKKGIERQADKLAEKMGELGV